ncbi:proline-rich receptor-like protein kinase PERK12 isoform X2 [Zingiber officinale]|uniref:proline-rich receptor-like protein kinase PERK12 isoform X2 n=1 Tax=Zingiber officinale TaxID=94328 RepID=UPI001C4D880C|nr:proline-rich receptor-like protein kinase PERK12 isoform X2 [Zingiber officinale]XP_042419008.1 proline-rich receptor-like protein kinase PERK12 isoform X2 [Zingiber officinale]
MTSSSATGGGGMPTAPQRVVVIQDASKDLSSSAIKWAIDGLSLKLGDELTLLGVLHHVNTPMGYRSKIDSNSVLATNTRIISEEVARKEEEYQRSAELLPIRELFESKKIAFNISVVAASSPKVAALEAVSKLKATWIILDRQMKKDKNFFLERLPCGISRMKRNNSVEHLREPRLHRRNDEFSEANVGNPIRYNEMLPGQEIKSGTTEMVLEFPDDGDLFSLELTAISSRLSEKKHTSIHLQEDDYISIQVAAEDKGSMTSKMPLTQNDENKSQEFGAMNQILEGEKAYPGCKVCGIERPKAASLREFTYTELCTATKGFCQENFLSEGGFGSVFRGELDSGQWIAVKQYKHASSQGEREFRSEVHLLGQLRHKYVVMLLGSCSERNHRLLVYEYVCNGSLEQHLSKNSSSLLTWGQRLKIAIGVAKGLNYLHQNNIIHRDMRPNNILLTHEYEAMLGDFGLSRKQRNESVLVSENKVVGTIGYLAPEYTERGRLSTKSDVYSFGVVLLELITGRTTMDNNLENKGLVGWARPLLHERNYPELIDERILDCHDLYQLFWMITVIEQCLIRDPDKRPSMEKVVHILKCMIDGEAIDVSETFSPAHSSANSLPSENVSQDEQEFEWQEKTSDGILSTNISQTSEPFSTVPSSESSTRSRSFWNIMVNPQGTKIYYDEMLT